MFPDMLLRDRRERGHGGDLDPVDTSATQAPRRVLRLLVSPAAPAGLWAVPQTPGGDPGAGREPQGATYSRRRLESPWKTLALRQPMRLLERSLQGKRRGHQRGGHPAAPSPRGQPSQALTGA